MEIRAYFADLMTPEVEAEVAAGGDGRPRLPGGRAQDGPRRLARHRLADRVRRPGPHRRRAVHLLQRVLARQRADPVPQHQHRRPHDHGVRLGGAEAALPAQDPRGGAALLHRLHRAERRHGPGLADHPGRQGRRRVGHQRPEDLHVAGQLRRLHLARRPDRPGGVQAQGDLDLPRAHHRPRVLVLEDLHDGERQHLQHLLRRCAGGRRRHRLRREPRLGPHHQPAQLRARVARPARDGRADLRGGPRLGAEHQAPRRPAGGRPGVGAAQPGPGARQARVREAHQLEGGGRRAAPTPPTRAPPRCSPPSSTPRPTGS